MSSGYSEQQRQWALTTYKHTREQYRSRLECCTAIARQLNAHVNTVTRWINAEHGHPRALTSEEIPARIRDLEAQVAALQSLNLDLMEQLNGRRAVGS